MKIDPPVVEWAPAVSREETGAESDSGRLRAGAAGESVAFMGERHSECNPVATAAITRKRYFLYVGF